MMFQRSKLSLKLLSILGLHLLTLQSPPAGLLVFCGSNVSVMKPDMRARMEALQDVFATYGSRSYSRWQSDQLVPHTATSIPTINFNSSFMCDHGHCFTLSPPLLGFKDLDSLLFDLKPGTSHVGRAVGVSNHFFFIEKLLLILVTMRVLHIVA